MRQELHITCGIKTETLNAKENNTIDQLEKQSPTEENNVLVPRQALPKEMESLWQQENEMRFVKYTKRRTPHALNRPAILRF